MRNTYRFTVLTGSLLIGLLSLILNSSQGLAEEPDDAVIQMVADLVGDPDRDMRALGYQQIREEMPGEAATKKFAQLLPSLTPKARAGLLEALGDRGDPAALEAVLASVEMVAPRGAGAGPGCKPEIDASYRAFGTSVSSAGAAPAL